MAKRKKAIRLRMKQSVVTDGGAGDGPERFGRPKAGPGQVFKRELVGADTGHAKRYRNVGASALMLAFHRGALAGAGEGKSAPLPGQITAQDRLDCGEKFETWWDTKLASPGRDSTIQAVGGGERSELSENQQYADRQIALLRERMSGKNYLIVEAFCGIGHSMLDALRHAGIEAHPVGTAFRVREAMDELVAVITGRMLLPMLVPGPEKKSA